MPLFFLYSLVYIICSCILIISLHPFMSFRIKVLMQITLNMFLFILQDLFGSPFFCDLCFDILPCISSWSQHAFPFKVNSFFIKQCINPRHCQCLRHISVQWPAIVFFSYTVGICSLDKPYNMPLKFSYPHKHLSQSSLFFFHVLCRYTIFQN